SGRPPAPRGCRRNRRELPRRVHDVLTDAVRGGTIRTGRDRALDARGGPDAPVRGARAAALVGPSGRGRHRRPRGCRAHAVRALLALYGHRQGGEIRGTRLAAVALIAALSPARPADVTLAPATGTSPGRTQRERRPTVSPGRGGAQPAEWPSGVRRRG